MSSSASLAASILKNMASVKMTDSDLPTPAPAADAAPASPLPNPMVASVSVPKDSTSSDADYDECDHYLRNNCGGDHRFCGHSYCCGYNYEDDAYEPFSYSGTISKQERLRANFALFGLDMDRVVNMMRDTSMVIGGGFMVNHILAMNGLDKPLCPSSDIDFYVYGGIIPQVFTGGSDRKAWNKYNSERQHAVAFRTMVTRRFYELVNPVGYNYACTDSDYNCERTETGDRIFTTGSKIRLNVLTYTATINGQTKKLNLVFSDTDMYDFIAKVDISLTAGFLCPNYGYQSFDYHHAAPQDVIEHRLKWLEPDSTHTPRQKERMAKYRTRYDLLETLKMTTAEFIHDYDTLPDENVHIELKGTEDEIHSKPVVRRVLGMPSVKFSIAVVSSSVLGGVTVYSNFPTAADRAEYARQKACAQVPATQPRNPTLVVYDDAA